MPIVSLNVFVVPHLVHSDLFWSTNSVLRIWQGVLVGSSIQLLLELYMLRGYNIYKISTEHYSH